MKKILLLFISLIVTSSLFLIFNDRGNEYLKPYLSNYLESKLENKTKIEVEHLKIDYNYIEFTAKVNRLNTLNAYGNYDLLNKTLNLDYNLKSNGFKSKEFSFDNKIDINGTVKGLFNNLDVTGEGLAFDSKLNYNLKVEDELVKNIKIHLIRANIAQLLLLTAQPAYAKGKIDIDIDIPTLEGNQTRGKAHLVLHNTKLNEKVFNKEYKLNLPKNTTVTAKVDSTLQADLVKFNANIKSNLLTLKLNNAHYDLKKEELFANYNLLVPKLSKLAFLTKTKLFGKFKALGSLRQQKKLFSIDLLSKSLGGETKFSLQGERLNAKLKNIEIAKLLHTLGEKAYLTGKVNSSVNINNLKNLKGEFTLNSSNLQTVHRIVKKEFDLDLGKNITLQLNSQGDIDKNIANIQTTLNSELFNLQSEDIKYDLKTSTLTANYLLNLPKLSKLNRLAGKNLQGKMAIDGDIKVDKKLYLRGKSTSLDGVIDFTLQDKQLSSTIKDVSVQKLMYVLAYPQIFKAYIVGKFDYNLEKQQGEVHSQLNKAQLLPNKLTDLVKQIRGIDLTKERYTETYFNAKLNKALIGFDFNTKSRTVQLAIPNGKINKTTNTINANYKLTFENKDIEGKIKGNISNPKVSIDGSKFIKERILNRVKKEIGTEDLKNLEKDLGIGKKEKEMLKGVLKNIFK